MREGVFLPNRARAETNCRDSGVTVQNSLGAMKRIKTNFTNRWGKKWGKIEISVFRSSIKNPTAAKWLDFLGIFGRGGGIRTRDPLHPMQVRYQAALRPDKREIIPEDARANAASR